ncbi:MAG: MFS transporter [Acidimicrobiia bacterium]|nr:MFS transporter [Acidimicrobiia bacterium]
MSQAVAPLRIRHFRALWIASVVSNVGSFLQGVAGSWLMLELTGSATWVGFMVASTTLPLLFLALTAGALADLVDRAKLLLVSQIVMGSAAAAMAIVTSFGRIGPGLLLALGLLLGVGMAFNLPAWQAMVPDLVPRGMVASAVALNSVAFNVARAVGPALGGLIVATSGPELAFGLNALSYAGVIGVLVVMRRTIATSDKESSSVANAIALGVRYARFTQAFRRLLLLAALFAMTSAVIQAVLPTRTEDLGGSAAAYGLMLGAMGLGALMAAFLREQIVRRLGTYSLPATIGLFGLAGIAVGAAPSIAWSMVALLVAGAAWVWTLTTTNATAQLMAPSWVRGRAMSLYSLAFVGVLPIGSILAGASADLIGAGQTMMLFSFGSLLLAVLVPRLKIPALADVATPEFTDVPTGDHADTEGGPVMVVNTWDVNSEDLDAFAEMMAEVRLVRLRTGAYRWRLYRNAENPHRLSEVFLTVSWAEHLAQHRRIDDASAALLRQARTLDRTGSPVSRHLVAVDVEDPEGWDQLLASHEQYHRDDGSIPLDLS